MANMNCSACEDIRQNSPSVIVNGLGETECVSLQNDTGLNPSSGNDDCTDLNNLNDCLVGNMATEVEMYEVCDWKTFMKQFIPNLWTTLKAMICAICGLWTNVKRLNCLVNLLSNGASFRFDEYTDTGESYIVAGKGVSFANISASGTSQDITIEYIAGGIARLRGSCKFYTSNFTDRMSVASFDNGGTSPVVTANRKGNSRWGQTGYVEQGGQLIYEVRIKRSEFPQIRALYSSHAFEGAGGALHCPILAFNAGNYAYGQVGWCDVKTGDPVGSHSERGHLVPEGWIYLQLRLASTEIVLGSADGLQGTPTGILPIRISSGGAGCE